jgi:hypothetical protein
LHIDGGAATAALVADLQHLRRAWYEFRKERGDHKVDV